MRAKVVAFGKEKDGRHAVGMTAAIEKLSKSLQCIVEAMNNGAVGFLDAIGAYNHILRCGTDKIS